jgi:hypothetical protein
MIRRIRFIYGKVILGFQKGSGIFQHCMYGSSLEGSRGATSGTHTFPEAHLDQVEVPRPTWAWGISPARLMQPAEWKP